MVSERSRSAGGGRGLAALAAGAVLLGLLGVSCHPERPLEDHHGPAEKAPRRPTASRRHAKQSSPGPEPAPPAPSGAPANAHLAMGVPTDGDPSDDHLMVKPQYALSYNRRRNVA